MALQRLWCLFRRSRSKYNGQKFLRGYQATDRHGNVRFTTIYPGWYSGRAVHIHAKIRVFNGLDQLYEFTTQFFFDDDLTDRVFRLRPYNERPARDTYNYNDNIYFGASSLGTVATNSGEALMLQFESDTKRARASLALVVDPSLGSSSDQTPGGPGGGPGGPGGGPGIPGAPGPGFLQPEGLVAPEACTKKLAGLRRPSPCHPLPRLQIGEESLHVPRNQLRLLPFQKVAAGWRFDKVNDIVGALCPFTRRRRKHVLLAHQETHRRGNALVAAAIAHHLIVSADRGRDRLRQPVDGQRGQQEILAEAAFSCPRCRPRYGTFQ